MEFCAATEFFRLSQHRLVSVAAEETDAGVAMSVAFSASEGGRRSVSMELETCLPVRPFFLCLLRQVLFEARETLVHFLFPGGPVCYGCFPGFEFVLAGVLVPQLRASGRSLPCHQLTIEKVLGDASVFHAADVAQPSHASLFEEGEHGRDACSFEHCAVCHLVSPRLRRRGCISSSAYGNC